MVREIGGKKTVGAGEIVENRTESKTKILMVDFQEQKLKVVYPMSGDLDNYPRLTGVIYEPKGETGTQVGVEALFPVKGPR